MGTSEFDAERGSAAEWGLFANRIADGQQLYDSFRMPPTAEFDYAGAESVILDIGYVRGFGWRNGAGDLHGGCGNVSGECAITEKFL